MPGRAMLYRLLLTTSLLSSAGFPQQRSSLRIVAKTSVPGQRILAVQEPVKCSSEGQVLAQFVLAGSEPQVSIIADNGGDIGWVGPAKVEQLRSAALVDFAPGSHGDVFLLLAKNDEAVGVPKNYIVRFDKDGTSRSVIRLDTSAEPDFAARQLAVFGSGSFFVSGYRVKLHSAAAGIFDSRGDFLRAVVLKGDLTTKATQYPRGMSTKLPEEELQEQVDLSWAQSAADGSVYLVRNTPRGPVFIVSDGGSVRKVALKPPQDGVQLASVKLDRATIAVEYHLAKLEKDGTKHFLVLTDMTTGRVTNIAEYTASYETTGLGAVCYKDSTFTFLSLGTDNHLQVVKAILQ